MTITAGLNHVARITFMVGALGASTVVTPLHAADIDFASDNALARTFLPYVPWVFDLAVQSGRSFGEITYGRRGYDAITASFFVNDLHVHRDVVDVSIGQLRVGSNSLMLEGIEVDTRSLDLPPPLREALRKLGRDTVAADILINVGFNAPRSAYDVAFSMSFADIGSFAMGATVDGLHVLVPLSDLESGTFSAGPIVSGTLIGASIAYRDAGLIETATELGARDSGVSADELRAGIKAMIPATMNQMLESLPGGPSQALRDVVSEWARQAGEFLDTKGDIRITLAPAEPVALALLQTGRFDEALIAALNPIVTNSFDAAPGGARPANALDAASALISGQGAPQDRDAGAQALLGLAAAGDLDAVRKIGTVFGSGPAPNLDEAGRASLYAALLVARALDDDVSDEALSRAGAGLTAQATLAAEREASAYFQAHGDGEKREPLSGANIAGYDSAALRALAYDLYEGHGVPRNFTEAYAVALVAAAAGDPFAARLRDDLSLASQENRVVLSLADAHGKAGMLWAAYQASHGAAADPQ